MIIQDIEEKAKGTIVEIKPADTAHKVLVEAGFDDVIEPDAGRVIFGLRDTGYDFNTAIADIIDNSITAKATKVDVSINITPKEEIKVVIADNGCGMDVDELRNAMKYGSKERTNRKSLSKFGLGLKTASTAFCRCLSLISRGKDNVVRKIQWDLDFIAEVNQWKPKTAQPNKDEIHMLESIAGDGTGTVVIWEKVDRLLAKGLEDYKQKASIKAAVKNKKEKLRHHLGLTFQRFLDPNFTECPNVEITMDMTPVEPIDPFCRNETETIPYPLNKGLMISVDDGQQYPVAITAYVLPRQADFSTPKAREDACISVNTEGFYIYRENRLIHYGDWLDMFSNEPHYSLLRVEFSFGAELDTAFNVDIKKSRILPAEEIVTWIKDNFIGPARRAANDRYRKGTTKQVADKTGKFDAHASSNRNIEKIAPKVEESKMVPDGKDTAVVTNENGTFKHKIEILSGADDEKMRIIPVKDLEYGNLWQPCLTAEGKHSIKLNQNHPFYQKVYYPILQQNVMVTGIDALLWALAEAENSTVNKETEEYYVDMRTSVSRQLKKLLQDLPEPELDDEEDDENK